MYCYYPSHKKFYVQTRKRSSLSSHLTLFKSHTCSKSLFYCKHQASSSQSQKEGVFTKHAICGEILVVEIDNEFLWLEAKLLIENLVEEMSVYKGSTHNIHLFYHGIVVC